MNDSYVILTGSKNNAGDFFIKYRAKQLFAALRPDRTVVDFDGWKPLTPSQLSDINQARALILCGGPALRYRMWPDVYALTARLQDITAPIVLMGVGSADQDGSLFNAPRYVLGARTLELLERVRTAGYLSSVRDYHTLNILFHRGVRNVLMTGCPALYDLSYVNQPPVYPNELKSIAFSLGVKYKRSRAMGKVMQRAMLAVRDTFPEASLTVFVHHAIVRDMTLDKEMFDWLERESIVYRDISGGVDEFLRAYAACDLHVGFRVHAHVYCCSMSKPSVLISEDGRGKALYGVLGGVALEAFKPFKDSIVRRARLRLGVLGEVYDTYRELAADVVGGIEYERLNGFPRMRVTRAAIDVHFVQMKRWLEQLP